MNPLEDDSPRLRAASTLFAAPVAELEDLKPGVVAAIGVYCDHFCEGQPGGRFAARQLRYTSTAAAADVPQSVVDLGDFNVFPLEPEKTLDALSTQAQRIVAAGAKPFAIGGDYSVSPAIVKGVVKGLAEELANELAREAGADRLAVIRISRRLDLFPRATDRVHEPRRRSATRELSALLGGGLSAVALLGGRGVVTAQESHCASAAVVVSARELVSAPAQTARTVQQALRRVADRFYLSVDVDVLAPRFGSVALPNTQGGLSLAQLLGVVDRFNGLPFVGAELTGHVPNLDVAGRAVTTRVGSLAGRMLESLSRESTPCR